MAYLKRFSLLVILIGLSILSNELKGDVNTGFEIEAIGMCLVNVLFIIIIIYAYNVSQNITRSTSVIVFESIILVILIIYSFKPQINELLDQYISSPLDYHKISLSTYSAQLLLGFWIVSFINILRNRGFRRKSMINTARYMRP